MAKLTDSGTEPSKQIRLIHGCIRQNNSITSRDAGNPQYFDTMEEAEASLRENEKFYRSIGYKIWFANFAKREGDKYVEIRSL